MSQTCNTCGGPLLQGVRSNRCPRCLVELGWLEDTPEELQAGDWVDRYKLIEQIGEGGFGIVYLAEQFEPVKRRVALKIIKPGMDTRRVVARFEAERQALAVLDHPNIAKVLDGGTTSSGRPYFVMELVRGVPMTQFCDAHQLSTPARLQVFIQVCQAVQHAHQKGIIHRDLKPSNVLVGSDDSLSPALPKVIDFGIAKATNLDFSERTLFSQSLQFIGTPAYVSPEQSELTGVDIDTRSDIYSLGVMLYELLTGYPPYDPQALLRDGFDKMRRMLREQEPPRPSIRLKSLPREELNVVSRHHHSEPPRLIQGVCGDLDWIVMKALEKDRARRYQTAHGLAMDLQRHLNHEPVLAQPPSRIYRIQKAIRRNRLAFTLGAAALVALIAGFVATTLLYFRERREHEHAEQAERSKTEQLWRANLATAQAKRQSDVLGRRFESLSAISNAAAIRVSGELRNEAIAALALTDLGPPKLGQDTPWIGDHSEDLADAFDTKLQRVALLADDCSIHVYRVQDHAELLSIPPNPGPTLEFAMTLRFSPDDSFLAARYNNGVIRCWQLEPFQLRLETSVEPPHWFSFGFSADSHWLAAGTSNQLSAFDLRPDRPPPAPNSARDEPDATLQLAANPGEFAFDSTSRLLAIVVGDTEVQIWNWPDRRFVRRLREGQGVPHVLWHPDSHHLITGTVQGAIHLWDTVSGSCRTLSGHRSFIHALALHPRGDVLASDSWDGTTKLWDINDGIPMLSTEDGGGRRFSRDGFSLGFRHYSHRYGTWPIAVTRVYRRLASTNRSVGSVNFHPQGKLLVWTDDFGVGRLDLGTGYYSTRGIPGIKRARFNNDGSLLLVDTDAGLRYWTLDKSNPTHDPLPLELELAATGTSQIPRGYWHWSHLANDAVLSIEQYSGSRHHRVLLRDTSGAERVIESPSRAAIMGASLGPDGRWLALGHHKGPTFVLDTQSGTTLKKWAEVKTACVSFTPDGRWLITGNGQRYQFWETGAWLPGRSLERGKASPIGAAMSFSNDGRLLVCVKSVGTLQLLDWRTGETVADLISPRPQGVIDLCFSPDNSLLAVIGDKALELWDLRELRKELASFNLDWKQPPYPLSTNTIGELVFRLESDARY